MKKLATSLMALAILFAAMLVLTGCDGQSVNPDLVGTWVLDRDLGFTMTLREYGTGRRGAYQESLLTGLRPQAGLG